MIRELLLSMCFATVIAFPTHAAQSTPLIAAVTYGDIWLYGADGDSRQVTFNAANYTQPVWSADGSLLAFTGDGVDGSRGAFIAQRVGGMPVQVARGVHPLLPVSFSPADNQLVYAALPANAPPDTFAGLVEVYTFAPIAGAAPVRMGEYNYDGNCLDDPLGLLPQVYRWNVETRAHPEARTIFAMMPFGLLYNANCRQFDLWLLRPNGERVRLFESVDGVFVAPEQRRAVVVRGGALVFVNTEKGPYTELTPVAPPDQVGFGLPGSNEVFYSTRTLIAPTPLPDDAATTLGNYFFELPNSYHVTIRRFSLRTGIDEELYSADAFGVGRLAITPDGESLLFSQVDNPDGWVEQAAAGAFDLSNVRGVLKSVRATVYRLSLADKSVKRVGVDWEQFAVQPASLR